MCIYTYIYVCYPLTMPRLPARVGAKPEVNPQVEDTGGGRPVGDTEGGPAEDTGGGLREGDTGGGPRAEDIGGRRPVEDTEGGPAGDTGGGPRACGAPHPFAVEWCSALSQLATSIDKAMAEAYGEGAAFAPCVGLWRALRGKRKRAG